MKSCNVELMENVEIYENDSILADFVNENAETYDRYFGWYLIKVHSIYFEEHLPMILMNIKKKLRCGICD